MPRFLPGGIVPLFFLLAVSFSLSTTRAAPLQDAEGVTFAKALPAKRIISLAPHLTDMLVRLGARSGIVGVSDDHEVRGAHAVSLSGFPVVSDAASVNYERVLALKPDLVLAWGSGTPRAWIARLRELGLPVFVIDAVMLDGLAAQLELLGRLSGHERLASQQAEHLRADIHALQEKYGAGPRQRYFHQVWLQPLYSLHAGHLLSQALALCGADNIVKAGAVAAPLINPEFVLQENPDIILFSESDARSSRTYWQRFPALTAVKHRQLLAIDDRRLTRPGPEMLEAVIPVCAQIAMWRSGREKESR